MKLASLFSWLMIFECVCLLTVTSSYCQAQNQSSAKLRRLYVPLESRKQWPEGDWFAVSRTRLEDYEASLRGQLEFNDIDNAVYDLNWQPEQLTGTIQLNLDSRAFEDQYVPLGTLGYNTNLAPSSATTIALGRDSSGRDWLYQPVSQPVRPITLTTVVPLREQGAGWVSQLSLVPALRSIVKIKTPENWTLKCDDDCLLEVASLNGQLQWTLTTHSLKPLRIECLPASGIRDNIKSLTVSTRHSYTIQPTQTEIVCDLRYNQVGLTSNDIVLDLPAEFTLISISNEQGQSVEYQLDSRSEGQRLTTRLQWSNSSSRLLRLKGTLPTSRQSLWALPAITTKQAFELSSRALIRIHSPLVLDRFEHSGWKLSDAAWSSDHPIELTLDQIERSRPIELVLNQPGASWIASNAISLFMEHQTLRATNRIELTSDTSSTFTAELDLPAGWTVQYLSNLSQTDFQIANWTVRNNSGQQSLLIEFRERIALSKVVRLEILLTHAMPDSTGILPLPLLIPISTVELKNCQIGLNAPADLLQRTSLLFKQQPIPATTTASPDWPFPQTGTAELGTYRYWKLNSTGRYNGPQLRLGEAPVTGLSKMSLANSAQDAVSSVEPSTTTEQTTIACTSSQYTAELLIKPELNRQAVELVYRISGSHSALTGLTEIQLPETTVLKHVSIGKTALPFDIVPNAKAPDKSTAILARHQNRTAEYLLVFEAHIPNRDHRLQLTLPEFSETVVPANVVLNSSSRMRLQAVCDQSGMQLPFELLTQPADQPGRTQRSYQLWIPQSQSTLTFDFADLSSRSSILYAFVLTSTLCLWLKSTFRRLFHLIWSILLLVSFTFLIWTAHPWNQPVWGTLTALLIIPMLAPVSKSRSAIRRYFHSSWNDLSSSKTSATVVLIVGSSLCGIHVLSALPAYGQQRQNDAFTNVVLVPFAENSLEKTLDYVYVNAALADRILKPANSQRPRWLFERAVYQQSRQSLTGQLDAELSLYLTPELNDQDEIVLPGLTTGDLLTGQVLINNEPVFINVTGTQKVVLPASAIMLILKQSDQTEFQLDSPKQVNVKLELIKRSALTNPKITPATEATTLQWNLLGIPNQSLISIPQLSDQLKATLPVIEQLQPQQRTYLLGSSKGLEIASAPVKSESISGFLDIFQRCDLEPDYTTISYVMDFELTGLSDAFELRLPLPENAILAEVSGTEILNWNIPETEDGLLLALNLDPKTLQFSCTVRLHIPTAHSKRSIPFLQPQFVTRVANLFQIDQQLIGFGSSLGIGIKSLNSSPSGAIRFSSVPSGFTGSNTEKLMAGLEVYRVTTAREFELQLDAIERSPRQQIEAELTETTSELLCKSEIAVVPQSTLFQQTLTLGNRVTIDSVTVKSRQLNKLARWIQRDQKLILFFTERLRDPYRIELNGRLPLPRQSTEEYYLPQIENALQSSEHQLTLNQLTESQLMVSAKGWQKLTSSGQQQLETSRTQIWKTADLKVPVIFSSIGSINQIKPLLKHDVIVLRNNRTVSVYDLIRSTNQNELTLFVTDDSFPELDKFVILNGEADISRDESGQRATIQPTQSAEPFVLLVEHQYDSSIVQVPLAKVTGNSETVLQKQLICSPQILQTEFAAKVSPPKAINAQILASLPELVRTRVQQAEAQQITLNAAAVEQITLQEYTAYELTVLQQQTQQQTASSNLQFSTYWILTPDTEAGFDFHQPLTKAVKPTHLLYNGISVMGEAKIGTDRISIPLQSNQNLHCLQIAMINETDKWSAVEDNTADTTGYVSKNDSQNPLFQFRLPLTSTNYANLLEQWLSIQNRSLEISLEFSELIKSTLAGFQSQNREDLTEVLQSQQPLETLLDVLTKAGLSHLIPRQLNQKADARILLAEPETPSIALQNSFTRFQSIQHSSPHRHNQSLLWMAQGLLCLLALWLAMSRVVFMRIYRLLREIRWVGLIIAGIIWLLTFPVPVLGLILIGWGVIGCYRRYAQHQLRSRLILRRQKRQAFPVA